MALGEDWASRPRVSNARAIGQELVMLGEETCEEGATLGRICERVFCEGGYCERGYTEAWVSRGGVGDAQWVRHQWAHILRRVVDLKMVQPEHGWPT